MPHYHAWNCRILISLSRQTGYIISTHQITPGQIIISVLPTQYFWIILIRLITFTFSSAWWKMRHNKSVHDENSCVTDNEKSDGLLKVLCFTGEHYIKASSMRQ